MRQILIAIDQLLNVLLFWWLPGGTWADETISSRCWRIRDKSTMMYKIVDSIIFWESNHCYEAYQIERKRLDTPPELRETQK